MKGFGHVRIAAGCAGAAAALLFTLGTASVAVASDPLPTQVPDEDVTDAVEDAADPVEDAVEEPVEDVTDAVEDAADPVEDVTDPAVDTVEDTTDPLDDAIEPVTDAVTDVVDDVTASVDDAVDGSGGTVGSGLGGDSKAEAPTFGTGDSGSAAGTGVGGDGVDGSETAPGRSTLPDATTFEAEPARASTKSPADSSLLEDIVRNITGVATRLAFPLALALVVLAFLAVQDHLDRKDPKLALAPVDSLQEYMSFR